MGRRLEKIEKEMGYCEIKLEKEKRIRKQIEFVTQDLAEIEALLRRLNQHDDSLLRSTNRELHDRPSKEAFLSAGLRRILDEKRELLLRDHEDLNSKLLHYLGFEKKKRNLEEEKKEALRDLPENRSGRLRRINDDFKKIEHVWNELSEDLINLDEGIFFLERNLDYLRSSRNFLISAKGGFDIEMWRKDGYLTDLFRHSNIGRALEMADGADRNIQSAQKELVCVYSYRVKVEALSRVLLPFTEALFEDLFEIGRLDRSIQVIEAALAGNLKQLEQIKAKGEIYSQKLEHTEKSRNQLFQRMGIGRRSEMTA